MKHSIFIPFIVLLGATACNCKPCPSCPEKDRRANCEADPNEPRSTSTVVIQSDVRDITPSTANLMISGDTWVDTSIDSLYTLHSAIRIGEGGNICTDTTMTNAIITLPQNTVLTNVTALSKSGELLSWQQCKGVLTVKLSYLCPHLGSDTISVTVRRSPYPHPACQPSFSVHAYSSVPDLDPSNNYWWWRRTCGTGKEDYTPLDPTWGPQ